MKEDDKNTEEVAGSNDSNWVSRELGMEEDDEEGELLQWALNIFWAFWQQRNSKLVEALGQLDKLGTVWP